MTFDLEPQFYIHSVPPSAISSRYYALSNPYDYPAEPIHPTIHADDALSAGVITGAPATAQPAVTAQGVPQTFPTSASIARVDPVLPNRRRNGDNPGGESRPLAEPTTQHEVGPALLRLGYNLRLLSRVPTGTVGPPCFRRTFGYAGRGHSLRSRADAAGHSAFTECVRRGARRAPLQRPRRRSPLHGHGRFN